MRQDQTTPAEREQANRDSHKLAKATFDFMESNCQCDNPYQVMTGAMNIMAAQLAVIAKDKDNALRLIKANAEVQRFLINRLPDEMFGGASN